MTTTKDWESAPVTYDLDFHDELMNYLLFEDGSRSALILANKLNMTMGVSARKRFHRKNAVKANPNVEEPTIEELRLAKGHAESALQKALRAQCPGPHKYVTHRSRPSNWCHACRHTSDGYYVPRSTPLGDEGKPDFNAPPWSTGKTVN